jgi:hypothetical protein
MTDATAGATLTMVIEVGAAVRTGRKVWTLDVYVMREVGKVRTYADVPQGGGKAARVCVVREKNGAGGWTARGF